MSGWTRHTGLAAHLPGDDIDTDQLIPARFMSAPRSEGYGDFLLHDVRQGAETHPLDAGPRPSILLAGANFGCGSSREAAVYALVDYGIRAVLAPGFGDIFAGNAVNNGLLPAQVSAEDHAALAAALAAGPAELSLDIDARRWRCGVAEGAFALDEIRATKLVNGWDDIDLTRRHADAIARFADTRRAAHPWSWPGGEAGPAPGAPRG